MKKISQLTTDEAIDVFCSITPYINNIVSDEELLNELKSAINIKDTSTLAEKYVVIGEKLSSISEVLLKKRRNDVYGILSVFENKSIEEISKQPFIKTMIDIRTLLKDKELVSFFMSCMDTEGGE